MTRALDAYYILEVSRNSTGVFANIIMRPADPYYEQESFVSQSCQIDTTEDVPNNKFASLANALNHYLPTMLTSTVANINANTYITPHDFVSGTVYTAPKALNDRFKVIEDWIALQ